ncbi:MAG: branched-chain amino acid ABC transporter permease [Ectothiorhodospiraceae bacterium]|nr:branched-chain amino acid ABC transporter permease [Chromatiales bacterium]MCP5155475.1 branched-chain amino acid ABC transporter permease [Ectothiorhodospiraceae bacterium]
MRRDPLQIPTVVLLVLAMAAWWHGADFYVHEVLLSEIALFAMLAMSLDLLVGYAGMVSLGHAAFLGIGAYVTAGLTVFLGWPVALAMPASALVAGLAALVVGSFVVRLGGVFFIMITLAIGQMVYAYFLKAREFGADDGMSGIPRLDLSFLGLDTADPAVFSAVLLLAALAVYLLLRVVVRSPYGATLVAIHQNEGRVRALGCPVHRYKLGAYVLAAAIAGLAGSLTTQHSSFVSPDLAFWTVSGEVLIMVILGGGGSIVGAAIGACAFLVLKHWLSAGESWEALGLPTFMADHWQLVMGSLFVLVVLVAADGIYGRARRLLRRDGPQAG